MITLDFDYMGVGFNLLFDDTTLKHYHSVAKYACTVFGLFAGLLLISIMRTIFTSPGGIPDDQEWDMPAADKTPVLTSATCSEGEDDSIQ